MSAPRPEIAADQHLLAQVAEGNAASLGEFYDRHANQVFGMLTGMLRDRGEAEDVLQEVFVRVWERAKTYNPSLGSPAAWLIGIARHRAIDRLRARTARPELTDVSALEQLGDPVGGHDPESTAAMTERRRTVGAALAALAPEQRRLIELAYYLGYTQSELAALLGMPLGTVKTRIRAAMMALKRHLETVSATEP